MKLIKKYLPISEYSKIEYEQYGLKQKNHIVLHHTVSSGEKGVYEWWCNDGKKVATAYVVDKDGTIYEYFDPKYWSYHLGGKAAKCHNINSIGIEIANEGALIKSDDNYYWFSRKNKYKGKVFEYEWRGIKYWAEYTTEQFEAVTQLINYLCNKFNIPKTVYEKYDFNFDLLKNFRGIISHCNVRKDKTDISPAFNLALLKQLIEQGDSNA
jgi:N-acetyl-anhydromuramyl-L-alanine amidase AmpD